MKRLVLLVAVLAIGSVVFASGGGGEVGTSTGKNIAFPYKGDPIELTYYYVDFSYAARTYKGVLDDEMAKRLGNIKVKENLVGWSDYGTKLNIMLSTGELADITVAGDPLATTQKFGSAGVLLDYAKYLQYMPNYVKFQAKFPMAFTGDDQGHIYSIGQPIDRNRFGHGWHINSLYVKQGFKPPTTLDEMYADMKRARQMQPTVTPYIAYHSGYLGYTYWVFKSSSGVINDPETKKFIYAPYQDNFKRAITWLAKLYKEQLIDPDVDAMPNERFQKALTEAKWLYMNGSINTEFDKNIEEGQKTSPGFDIEMYVQPLEKPGMKRFYPTYETEGARPWFTVFTNSKTKYPEIVAQVLNYWLSPEIGELVNWGIEGKTFKRNADGSRSYLPEILMPSQPKGTIDAQAVYGLCSHFMIKQGGNATLNDWDAMDLYYNSPRVQKQLAVLANFVKANPSSVWPQYGLPTVTTEEGEQIAKIMTPVNTFVDEQIQKFITGARAIGELDDFVSQIKKYGDPEQVVKIYNSKPVPVYVRK